MRKIGKFRLSGALFALCYKQFHRCAYCSRSFSYRRLSAMCPTIDHIVAKSRGGSNQRNNKVAACLACNNAKGNLSVSEFTAKLVRAGVVLNA